MYFNNSFHYTLKRRKSRVWKSYLYTVLVSFPNKNNLRARGFTLAHNSRVESILVEKSNNLKHDYITSHSKTEGGDWMPVLTLLLLHCTSRTQTQWMGLHLSTSIFWIKDTPHRLAQRSNDPSQFFLMVRLPSDSRFSKRQQHEPSYSSTITASLSTWSQPKRPFTSKLKNKYWIPVKQDINLNKRRKFWNNPKTWVNLDNIVLSEKKYYMIALIWNRTARLIKADRMVEPGVGEVGV